MGTICRICASPRITTMGTVEYYSGFPWDVHQCRDCGCRFTRYDPAIYDQMYRAEHSIYGIYNELADECRRHFSHKDLSGLRELLHRSAKYRFIIDHIESLPRSAKTLEIGCSRGHLTSYFILAGYRALGADISREAIDAATKNFGPHFLHIGEAAIADNGPYDVIYHVGTIGCVGDPMGLTRDLLKMLKPGGMLLFNAPNLDSCVLRHQLWLDAATPPDVVTMFPSRFFSRAFTSVASAAEHIEHYGEDETCRMTLRRAFRKWHRPHPRRLETSLSDYKGGRPRLARFESAWTLLERVFSKIMRTARISVFIPKIPTPFGYFVTMRKPI